MNLEQSKEAAKSCEAAILREDYYVEHWKRVKHKIPIDQCTTPRQVLEPFQDFWEALPDARAIRRPPFFQVCDLAEAYMATFDEEIDDA